tara:strand:+ start:235 stop:516 length:282 start_codon:yes stop_codon:yes gene_type:complete
MSTEYIAEGATEVLGAEFTLTAGSSRLFYCSPGLGANESLILSIKNADATFSQLGTLASAENPSGTVTATGAGSSIFKVLRSTVSPAKTVYFD